MVRENVRRISVQKCSWTCTGPYLFCMKYRTGVVSIWRFLNFRTFSYKMTGILHKCTRINKRKCSLTPPPLLNTHDPRFVLLKERNAMLTADSFFRATLKLRNPYRERLKSVQQSMDNLRQVMEHRVLTITFTFQFSNFDQG